MKAIITIILTLLFTSNTMALAAICNVDGGLLSGGNYKFCVGDGIPDYVDRGSIRVTGDEGSSRDWIVTDVAGNILDFGGSLSDFNFEGVGMGDFLLYYMSFENSVGGLAIGNTLHDLSGCYDLSNALSIKTIPGNAPVANYNFYNDGTDISNNTNDLVKQSATPPISTYEGCRRYMAFGETNVGYLLKDDPTYDLADNGAFTVAFWMRTPDMTADQKMVGQADLGSSFSGYVIGPQNGGLKAEVFAGSPANTMTINSSVLAENTWYHVALVYSSVSFEYKIYINGVLDKEFDDVVLAWSAPAEDQELVVGIAPWDQSAFNYKGDLDDLRIFDINLSADKIENIYNDNFVCPQGLAPIYVDASASGRNTGLSWDDAFVDLQEAIEQSCNCFDRPDIWMASGTYRPTKIFDTDGDDILEEEEKTFSIIQPVKIYGGFRVGQSSIDGRDDYFSIEAPTILTGVLDNGLDTAFHVVTMRSTTSINADYALNRLTIRDGRALDPAPTSSSNSIGGGVFMSAGSINFPSISNCKFINNRASENGGAVSASGSSCNIRLSNCLFDNNHADMYGGGAIYASGQGTDVSLINNTLVNNSAANGGALYMSGTAAPDADIVNNIFWNNSASGNGADIYSTKGDNGVRISNSIISSGGIYIGDNMDIDTSTVFLHNDPMLDTDLMLLPGSPAFDAGDSTFVNTNYDLYGKPRSLGDRVEIGAYEYGVPCQQTLRYHLPQMFDNFRGFLGTEKDIIFNAMIKNRSDIQFSHFDGVTFTEEFEIDNGSRMIVYQGGCD